MSKKSQSVKGSIIGGGVTQRTAGDDSQQNVESTLIRESLSQDSGVAPQNQSLELGYGKFRGKAGGWIAVIALVVVVIVGCIVYFHSGK